MLRLLRQILILNNLANILNSNPVSIRRLRRRQVSIRHLMDLRIVSRTLLSISSILSGRMLHKKEATQLLFLQEPVCACESIRG